MIKKGFARVTAFVLCALMLFSVTSISIIASPVDIFDGIETAPINHNANQTARNFYQYLWNIRKSDSLLCGATSSRLIGVDTTAADAEHDYYQAIKNYFGVTPAIFAPFQSITYQVKNNYLPVVLERYQAGSVPLFHLHGSITSILSDTENPVEDPADYIVHLDKTNPDRDMNLYNKWVAELKETADYFEEVEKAGIEVYIFKMFSEMNNTSKQGLFGKTESGFRAFHNVWRQAVEYFTVKRGLTGILFAYCPAGFTGSEPLYPGDDYVDILSPTSYSNYSTGSIISQFGCVDYEWMKKRPKPFGFSELGPRGLSTTSPVGDWKDTLNSIIYAYPEASFAVLWYENRLSLFPAGDYSNNGNYNGDYFIYNPQVIVAEEMINYRTKKPLKSTGIAMLYSDAKMKKKAASLSLGSFSAAKLKSLSIDTKSIQSLKILHGCAIAVYETDNCTGTSEIFYGSNKNVKEVFQKAKSLKVMKLENLAFEKNIWVEGDNKSAYGLNDGRNSSWSHESLKPLTITIDLGKIYNVGQMSINHAGFFDDFKYNLRDFEIYTSLNGVDYTIVYREQGNIFPSSNFCFHSIDARYVKVKIITPNSSASQIEKNLISLAEIEVYGTDATGTYSDGFSDFPDSYGNDADVMGSDIMDDEALDDASDYGKESITVTSVEGKPGKAEIVIPAFYRYVWIIFCGGVLILAAGIGAIIYLLHRRKIRKSVS